MSEQPVTPDGRYFVVRGIVALQQSLSRTHNKPEPEEVESSVLSH